MTPNTEKSITAPRGFRAAGGACGIKPSGKPDLALILADHPCAAAGVFTTNKTLGAPVQLAKRYLRSGRAQAILCNSGISNSLSGQTGYDNAVQISQCVAKQAGVENDNAKLVLPASTGLIGPQLPMKKIHQGIADLVPKLSRGPAADADAAQAIMTTDLVPKQVYRSVRLGPKPGKLVHLGAIGKGSGMIAPNMATMLVFITTDANITPPMFKAALKHAAAQSFNRISVDAHTSPSDMVLALASARADHPLITRPGRNATQFQEALTDLCQDLAYQIVQDGEGATKVFRVRVVGAKTQRHADRVAKAIVDSPLVKTAVHGGDPNWGRIITAAGNSGVPIKLEKLSLRIGAAPKKKNQRGAIKTNNGVCVFANGHPIDLDKPTTKQLNQAMASREVVFTIDLAQGKAHTEWLGCDLSRQYITINADYTT